jgi:hypothetical protein
MFFGDTIICSGGLDLLRSELRNAVAQNLAAHPSAPQLGQMWFRTTDERPYWQTTAGAITFLSSNARLDQLTAPTSPVAMGGQRITGLADPTADTDAVNKRYADGLRAGIDLKDDVTSCATTNVTLNAVPATIGGETLSAGLRFAVIGQTQPADNGIYIYPSAAGQVAQRATDADTSQKLNTGASFWVRYGTQAGKRFTLTTSGDIFLGSTALTFVEDSASGVAGATAPMSLVSGNITLNTTARFALNGGNLDLASGVATPGTYTAITVDTYGRVTAGADIVAGSGVSVTNGDGVGGNITVAVAANYAGGSSISTVGTITSGVWQGAPVGVAFGGLGVNASDAAGRATARDNLAAAGVFRTTITGTGSATVFTITHNLNKATVDTTIRATNGTYVGQYIGATIARSSDNAVTITMNPAPVNGATFDVLVVG